MEPNFEELAQQCGKPSKKIKQNEET